MKKYGESSWIIVLHEIIVTSRHQVFFQLSSVPFGIKWITGSLFMLCGVSVLPAFNVTLTTRQAFINLDDTELVVEISAMSVEHTTTRICNVFFKFYCCDVRYLFLAWLKFQKLRWMWVKMISESQLRDVRLQCYLHYPSNPHCSCIVHSHLYCSLCFLS